MSRRGPLWGYLCATALGTTGTRVSTIAIPWFVLTSTGSATRTGIVAFAELAPLVVLQALSGPLIDRLGARRVAIACDLASVLVVGAIPLLHVLGALTFPLLLVLVALAGSLRGPGEAAKHAMLPLIVADAQVPTERVTGLAGAVERTASMAGAAIAGGLVALLGGANALVVDAASFLLSAGVLVVATRRLARPGGRAASASERVETRVETEVAPSSYLRELREGWDFMRRDVVLMGIGVMVALTNLLDQAWSSVLLPVWARDSGNGVAVVGLLGAVFGGSAILGSVTAATFAERLPRFWTYLVAFLLCGAPRFVALALDLPLGWILLVAVVGGCASGFLNPVLAAVLFERIPAHLMGRVSAMNIAMSWSLLPFGGILGGLLVTGFGISPALLFVGAAYFLTTMLPAVQPRWRELDRRPATDSRDPLASVRTS